MIVHFSAHISKWELVCKFGVIFHIFIISCLCSRFHVRNQWFFYSVITFSYIKCFVHSYTVDVVFTLSYHIQSRWLSRPLKISLTQYETEYERFLYALPSNRNSVKAIPICMNTSFQIYKNITGSWYIQITYVFFGVMRIYILIMWMRFLYVCISIACMHKWVVTLVLYIYINAL